MARKTKQKVEPEVAALIDHVINDDMYHSLQAAKELRMMGASAVAPLMDSFIDTTRVHARWRVAMALSGLGRSASDELIKVLNAEDASLRNPAIWALAEIGDQQAVDPLIACMNCTTEECCRALTAAALLKIGDPVGVKAVEKTLDSLDDHFRGTVYEALEGT